MDYAVVHSFKQVVNCGYCARSMRRKNLNDHTARYHKGCTPKTAEGEALKLLMEEIERKQHQEKERKEAERLQQANQKRLEKQRSRELEKEREILQQRELQAQRKEQEEARKKKKKELTRDERARSKTNKTSKNQTSSEAVYDADLPRSLATNSRSFKQRGLSEDLSPTPSQTCNDANSPMAVATDSWSSEQRGNSRICKNKFNTITRPNCGLNSSTVTNFESTSSLPTDNLNSTSTLTTQIGKGQLDTISEEDFSTTNESYSNHFNLNPENLRADILPELETREKFKKSKNMDDLLKHCPNFSYNENAGSLQCTVCSQSSCCKPIRYDPKCDDSKSLQLAKFRDVKKKMLDHLYKTSVHKKNLQDSSKQLVEDDDVIAGTRVIRAIYGKIKHGGGYKSIEETIAERAADNVDFGTINHGKHFASSMTSPIYEAVKKKIQKTLKRNMPGTGRLPPFCLIADKMTPARKTLQIVGIIHPSQETGELQSICLGVKECKDGTGLGTCHEMIDCLKNYYSTDEIKESLAGIAVDGAYHHHNIKDHMKSVLDLNAEENDVLATNWDAAHLIELAAQKSRGQRGSDKSISVPWIKDTFDTVTSVKKFAGRGKNWKELQDCASLESIRRSENGHQALESANVKPLKKFQSFSGTRFARFSQRVLGNMRENYMATCHYLETKSKDGSGLLTKLTRPHFVLRLCGLDDVYNDIGNASERLQSCRLYGWNAVEILEGTTKSLQRMAQNLLTSEIDQHMVRFNSAVQEVSSYNTYQGVPMQGSSSSAHTADVVASVRKELAQHLTDFTEDLDRRTRQQTPNICQISRDAFSFERVMSRSDEKVPLAFNELTKLYSAAGYVDRLKEEDWQREYARFYHAVREEKSRLDTNGLTKRQQMLKMKDEEAIYSNFFSNENLTEGFRNFSYLLCRSALRSSCEAVTEGMGSVVKNTLEGRENLLVDKLCQEVFVRLNGPKSNQSCDSVLRLAGDIRFGGRSNWHFLTSPKAKYTTSSKVVSRINLEENKFNFLSDDED